MTAIWLLSTRGRPRECQETLDACEATGMTSPGVVYVDETVDEYRNIRLPKNWRIHYESEWGSLQASMSWCYKNYPDASQYGWLADDTRPRTQGWDKLLEAAAGDWCLSYARDMWLSESPRLLAELEDGTNLSSGLCWGGKLVRTVGWWALPGVRQAFIDVAWCRLVEPHNLHRYMGHVTVEHLNWRTGKRPADAVDDWSRDGDDYIDRDIAAGYEFLSSWEFLKILRRLRGVVPRQPITDRQVARAVQKLRDDYADSHWRPGMSGQALTRHLENFDASGRGQELAAILAADADTGQAGVAAEVHPVGPLADVH